MPFAATVYSLLLASSAITTPAIEELTAIRQRELTEEEIAAQIEESRIERIESQFDGRELPQEIEAGPPAPKPPGAVRHPRRKPCVKPFPSLSTQPKFSRLPSLQNRPPSRLSLSGAFAKQPSPNRPTAFEKPPSRFPGSL